MKAFHWGLLVGFAAPVLLVIVLKVWIGPELYRPKFNVEVVSRGADVSRLGGARVEIKNGQGMVAEQACHDGCDDFQLQASSSDNSYNVRVLDPSGRTIASDPGTYVTDGYGAPVTRWTISGADALKVQLSFIDRKADGGFEEKPFSIPSNAASDRPDAKRPTP